MKDKVSIFIVDDHKIFLQGLNVLLMQNPNYEVVALAFNGQEFLELLPLHKPDVVLIDISMPEMDGITATEKALKLYPELKIIALTSFNDETYYYRMVEAGVCGFVLKKSTADEIDMAINAAMNGDSYFSQDLLKQIIKSLNRAVEVSKNDKKETAKFTDREKDVLKLICDGFSNPEIADKLNISVATVATHKANIFSKTGVNKTVNLIMHAIKHKLLED